MDQLPGVVLAHVAALLVQDSIARAIGVRISANPAEPCPVMTRVTALPDQMDFDVAADESVLEAALRSGVPFAHACGGRAKCSTCRVWILAGLEACPARNSAEAAMADRLRLAKEVRLACQLKPGGDLRVRRLVLDETDMMITSQLGASAETKSGEAKHVAVFFSDIANFTALSETLSPYDVMYLLNRYFAQVGDIIEQNGGFIDNFIGDGLMAVFGMNDQPDAPLRAINAALQTLGTVDRLKPFFASMYGIDFDIRIGLNYGEAVIGTLGFAGHGRLTAVGDVVNVASRIEAANKEAGTRLLISESLRDEIADKVEIGDFLRVRLRGTGERTSLFEVVGLKPEIDAELNAKPPRETVRQGGRRWIRAFAEDELQLHERRILDFEDYDVVVFRGADGYCAFNNACPHLHLPLYERRSPAQVEGLQLPHTESTITSDLGLVCRWHQSCFDLLTGEIRQWAQLQQDGTAPGYEYAGDISKNRAKLAIYPCRQQDGFVWIGLD
ncbi:adenylate/guanylate cyclase domain-containing protein [Ensifer aridi]|uniref:adenylate/guanylate cyclase domain-containing protein n=1 Tax=Ensifer aridi TaxID=1708715 RepID=UPI001553AE90|nr:adenylate/guanylate cyclase domain-containing protein [Ensifer aridi]